MKLLQIDKIFFVFYMNKIQTNKKRNYSNEKRFVRMQSTAQSKFCFIFTCFNKSLLETDIANAQQPGSINDEYTCAYDNNWDTFCLLSETWKPLAFFEIR